MLEQQRKTDRISLSVPSKHEYDELFQQMQVQLQEAKDGLKRNRPEDVIAKDNEPAVNVRKDYRRSIIRRALAPVRTLFTSTPYDKNIPNRLNRSLEVSPVFPDLIRSPPIVELIEADVEEAKTVENSRTNPIKHVRASRKNANTPTEKTAPLNPMAESRNIENDEGSDSSVSVKNVKNLLPSTKGRPRKKITKRSSTKKVKSKIPLTTNKKRKKRIFLISDSEDDESLEGNTPPYKDTYINKKDDTRHVPQKENIASITSPVSKRLQEQPQTALTQLNFQDLMMFFGQKYIQDNGGILRNLIEEKGIQRTSLLHDDRPERDRHNNESKRTPRVNNVLNRCKKLIIEDAGQQTSFPRDESFNVRRKTFQQTAQQTSLTPLKARPNETATSRTIIYKNNGQQTSLPRTERAVLTRQRTCISDSSDSEANEVLPKGNLRSFNQQTSLTPSLPLHVDDESFHKRRDRKPTHSNSQLSKLYSAWRNQNSLKKNIRKSTAKSRRPSRDIVDFQELDSDFFTRTHSDVSEEDSPNFVRNEIRSSRNIERNGKNCHIDAVVAKLKERLQENGSNDNSVVSSMFSEALSIGNTGIGCSSGESIGSRILPEESLGPERSDRDGRPWRFSEGVKTKRLARNPTKHLPPNPTTTTRSKAKSILDQWLENQKVIDESDDLGSSYRRKVNKDDAEHEKTLCNNGNDLNSSLSIESSYRFNLSLELDKKKLDSYNRDALDTLQNLRRNVTELVHQTLNTEMAKDTVDKSKKKKTGAIDSQRSAVEPAVSKRNSEASNIKRNTTRNLKDTDGELEEDDVTEHKRPRGKSNSRVPSTLNAENDEFGTYEPEPLKNSRIVETASSPNKRQSKRVDNGSVCERKLSEECGSTTIPRRALTSDVDELEIDRTCALLHGQYLSSTRVDLVPSSTFVSERKSRKLENPKENTSRRAQSKTNEDSEDGNEPNVPKSKSLSNVEGGDEKSCDVLKKRETRQKVWNVNDNAQNRRSRRKSIYEAPPTSDTGNDVFEPTRPTNKRKSKLSDKRSLSERELTQEPVRNLISDEAEIERTSLLPHVESEKKSRRLDNQTLRSSKENIPRLVEQIEDSERPQDDGNKTPRRSRIRSTNIEDSENGNEPTVPKSKSLGNVECGEEKVSEVSKKRNTGKGRQKDSNVNDNAQSTRSRRKSIYEVPSTSDTVNDEFETTRPTNNRKSKSSDKRSIHERELTQEPVRNLISDEVEIERTSVLPHVESEKKSRRLDNQTLRSSKDNISRLEQIEDSERAKQTPRRSRTRSKNIEDSENGNEPTVPKSKSLNNDLTISAVLNKRSTKKGRPKGSNVNVSQRKSIYEVPATRDTENDGYETPETEPPIKIRIVTPSPNEKKSKRTATRKLTQEPVDDSTTVPSKVLCDELEIQRTSVIPDDQYPCSIGIYSVPSPVVKSKRFDNSFENRSTLRGSDHADDAADKRLEPRTKNTRKTMDKSERLVFREKLLDNTKVGRVECDEYGSNDVVTVDERDTQRLSRPNGSKKVEDDTSKGVVPNSTKNGRNESAEKSRSKFTSKKGKIKDGSSKTAHSADERSSKGPVSESGSDRTETEGAYDGSVVSNEACLDEPLESNAIIRNLRMDFDRIDTTIDDVNGDRNVGAKVDDDGVFKKPLAVSLVKKKHGKKNQKRTGKVKEKSDEELRSEREENTKQADEDTELRRSSRTRRPPPVSFRPLRNEMELQMFGFCGTLASYDRAKQEIAKYVKSSESKTSVDVDKKVSKTNTVRPKRGKKAKKQSDGGSAEKTATGSRPGRKTIREIRQSVETVEENEPLDVRRLDDSSDNEELATFLANTSRCESKRAARTRLGLMLASASKKFDFGSGYTFDQTTSTNGDLIRSGYTFIEADSCLPLCQSTNDTFYQVIEGECSISLDESRTRLKKGKQIIVPKGTPFQIMNLTSQSQCTLLYIID